MVSRQMAAENGPTTSHRPRVAIISTNFWPERTGISQTAGEFAQYLASHGIDVTVATALPYYPEWRIWDRYRGSLWRTERKGALTVRRTWHYVSPMPSTFTRILHEFTMSVFGVPQMFRAIWRAQTVYVISPGLSYAFVGMSLSRLLGRRTVLVIKDVMPDAAIEMGMLRNRFLIRLSGWMARWMYRSADEIHTLGEGMRERIAQHVDSARVRIVPDTIDAIELAPVPPDRNEFRRRFVPPGTFAVLHTGNMGQKQDLDLVLRTANRYRNNPGVHFYVFGDGAMKDRFLRTKDEMGLQNISHYPLQDRDMLSHMLSGANVVLISQRPEVVDIVVPSKLLTALGAGATIIAACPDTSETARIIYESGGGLVVPPSDDGALYRAIEKIRTWEVNATPMRRRAREFALRRFERDAVYGPIVETFVA